MSLLKKYKDKDREQFKFSIEFQLELIRYLLQSKEAILYLKKIKPSYFTLLEHGIIVDVIHRCIKNFKKIPQESIFLEQVRVMLNHKDFISLTTKEDLPNIKNIVHDLYTKELKDEDIIKVEILKFIAYIELKYLNETTDFTDFTQYEHYYSKLGNILREANSNNKKDKPAIMMVEDVYSRQLQRKITPDVYPCPYKQLNLLTNGGGYPKGSIIVFLDKAKARKTFNLINIARGYLSMKKVVLYIDTENGANQIMDRMVQSTLNKTKKDLLSGEFDKLEKRHMRKYKRLKSEFIVKKIISKYDDANTIKALIQSTELELGRKVQILVVDYAAKMASISRKDDDFDRIMDIYLDLENLADEMDLETIITAHHTTRAGTEFKETRYEENHIAGAINIVRNAQVIIGLNSTQEEEDNGIQRLEIVVQRDGVPRGRAVFNVDLPRQRMVELSVEARKKYDETVGKYVDDLINNIKPDDKNKKVNVKADKNKANHRSGDI